MGQKVEDELNKVIINKHFVNETVKTTFRFDRKFTH